MPNLHTNCKRSSTKSEASGLLHGIKTQKSQKNSWRLPEGPTIKKHVKEVIKHKNRYTFRFSISKLL